MFESRLTPYLKYLLIGGESWPYKLEVDGIVCLVLQHLESFSAVIELVTRYLHAIDGGQHVTHCKGITNKITLALKELFTELLSMGSPFIKITCMRKPSLHSKLLVTFRFLTTSSSCEDMNFLTLVFAHSLGHIITETVRQSFNLCNKSL